MKIVTTVFRSNKRLHSKKYLNESGQVHREDGPAYIEYDIMGNLVLEVYYINGQVHREDGPAEISTKYAYYLNNKEVVKESLLIFNLNKELKKYNVEISGYWDSSDWSNPKYMYNIIYDGIIVNTCAEDKLEELCKEFVV